MTDLSEEVIEAIWEQAFLSAEQSSPYSPAENPYPPSSKEADIWACAYRQALASTWH
ncbi:MAG: hypothetical protein P4L79_10025 [Legionella sp.]|uniref:hypothetical protein n=1 Tax=Legionella sp. TaxID=459 RepID=UPI0028482C26|nr:hypothetical protein [Legionella sp.]